MGVKARCTMKVPLVFSCVLCGFRRGIVVQGHGSAHRSFGSAREAAKADALRNAEEQMELALCPRCNRRNPQNVAAFFTKIGLIVVVAEVIAISIYLGASRDRGCWIGLIEIVLVFYLLGQAGMWAQSAGVVTRS